MLKNLKLLISARSMPLLPLLLVLSLLPVLPLLSGCQGADSGSAPLSGLEDLDGRRIGVCTGTVYDNYATEHFPAATVLHYNSTADLAVAIKSGKIDAALTTLPAAQLVIQSNPDMAILSEDVLDLPLAVGFSKSDPELRQGFDRYLESIRKDGSYDRLYAKWFEGDPEKAEMPAYDAPAGSRRVILGVSAGDLPSVGYVNGRYVGFDIELVQGFARQENIALEIVEMDFAALVPALAAGKVDMITDGIAITEERQKQVDFSAPIMSSKSAALVLKSNTAAAAASSSNEPFTMDQLATKKVGVLLGSVHDSYMAEHYPGANVYQYKSYPDMVLALKSGKIDVGFYVKESFADLQKSDSSLVILKDNIYTVPIGMGFNQDNDALREQFNAFLKEIKASGVYDDMVKRWYHEGDYRMPVIENSPANGQIIIGNVSDKGLPFTAVKDNQLIGFDIEMDRRFASYLGKEPVFSDMEFGNLITAVASKKVDMITSTLMITEERKKQIDFSDPYYELSACIVGVRAPDTGSGTTGIWQRLSNSFYSNIILEDRYLLIWNGLKTTAAISLFSILFGTLLGALVCWMRMSPRRWLSGLARIYISIIRGVPVLVLLMIIFYVVFGSVDIDPVLVAIVAFGLNFAAYVSEMFRTSIESIDPGQAEAGIASGFTPAQAFFYIVFPQAVRQVLPVYQGELISLVKMTSVVGYIAVQDLTKAGDIIRSRTFDAFFPLLTTAVLYFAISWLLIMLLDALQRRSDPKRQRRHNSTERGQAA